MERKSNYTEGSNIEFNCSLLRPIEWREDKGKYSYKMRWLAFVERKSNYTEGSNIEFNCSLLRPIERREDENIEGSNSFYVL